MLTYALLAGAGVVTEGPLANQAIKASGDDKTVEIREWFSFAQDKVPLLTRLYLGQAYISDAAAGLAAGLVWLATCISGLEIARQRVTLERR